MQELADQDQSRPSSRSGFETIFVGTSGLRSGWKVLLFYLLTAAPAVGLRMLLKHRGYRDEVRFLIFEPTVLLLLLAAMWIMGRIERKPLSAFGLPGSRFRDTGSGALLGILSLGLLLALLTLAGVYDIGPVSLHGLLPIGRWALTWGVVFALVALLEELFTRGYALYALTRSIGFWPAAILLSFLFAAPHMLNKGENPIGILSAAVIGLVLAYSVRRTGALWWAIGYHFSWDWAQTYVFGVPNSGLIQCCHIFSGRSAQGKDWLSGGTVGPEGSVLVFVVIALLLAFLIRSTKNRPRAEPGFGEFGPTGDRLG
jgi:membrane protease YdiL (CAAX protease family)